MNLSSCSNNGTDDGHESSIRESADFNQADVDFASDMIQHHAQALAMVDLTVGRTLSSELVTLTEAVLATQGPEVELMVDWLNAWEQPIPETVLDHANAHHSDMQTNTDMPGMMSADQMVELESAQGTDFERLWLKMMIKHHEGAIEMAKAEQADGEDKEAIELARRIVKAQNTEIATMKDLLAS